MATIINPYVPSFLRAALSGSKPIQLTWSDVADTNIQSTSSFLYDTHATALKSTQQLNVDWSDFTQHTFFMSAEAKVNLAFDLVINGFPFDGTRRETEVFFERLTGFDRWVFDRFPTFHGELAFSGTQATETTPAAGTYIVVQNKTGALFPDLATVADGQPVLNPTGSSSMTIEAQLYLPAVANDNQVVCQMMSGTTQGFSFHLSASASTTSCPAEFSIVSGSSYMTVAATLNKGVFNHVALEFNRDNGVAFLEAFLQARLVAGSTTRVDVGDMAIDASSLVVGSGTQVTLGATTFTPMQTLSGTLDELRVFHSVRSPAQLAAYAQKALYPTEDLVLYYKFNEPPPPLALTLTDPINSIVLDYSGNSLHALVSNFTGSLRQDATADPLNPVVFERPETCPVLFPAYPGVLDLNEALLASASAYDQENPNLITKLVPSHYLLEGAQQDGFTEPEGTVNQPYGGSGVPGEGQMGSVQVMLSLLYIWAKFFDELKLYVDAFSTLRTVDYDTGGVTAIDTVPDSFLIDMVKEQGFHLPPLFNDSDVEQYVRGENVDIDSITTNVQSLRYVQNQLLRRVLKNLPDVVRSKGTQHSIKSFLRSIGIDPNNSLRIREFGGPTSQQLSFSRESKVEQGAMVQLTSSCLVVSPFLSASRTEPGFPLPAGTIGKHGSNNASDGLLTSGSWTWEGIVKYTPAVTETMLNTTQSLVRFCVTGSAAGLSNGSAGIVANLLAISSSVAPKLVLYVRPGASGSSSPTLRMELDTPVPNVYFGPAPLGIFNGDRWNVSFGRQRGDDGLNSVASSSYFLRLAYQNAGDVQFFETTSSFFQECPRNEVNALSKLDVALNSSGTFLAVGQQQLVTSSSTTPYLNSTTVDPEARTTSFDGRMSNVRFWSRALTVDEWREHVRNYNSTGVEDPAVGWNYGRTLSGSFGRLRLNSMTKQDARIANGTASLGPIGAITFLDFSENGMHLTGSGFPTDVETVVGEVFDLNLISPYFDEATSNEKVRTRSYQSLDLVDVTPWASIAPVYEIPPSEAPTDDVRFVIEFSLVDALNRDIVNMFATLDAVDNALGSPELVFSPDYPDLENLRLIYFNRLKEKLNFQAFFEFFRWFDASIGTFIEQLIPRKTRYKGTNFTVESHMLERHKLSYEASSQIYLGASIRTNLDAVILLQQIAGVIVKF